MRRDFFFFFQAEDGIRDYKVTGVQTCALPISRSGRGDAEKLTPSLLLMTAPSSPTPITLPSGESVRSVIDAVTPLVNSDHVLPASVLRQILPFNPATSIELSGNASPAQNDPLLPVLIRLQVWPPAEDLNTRPSSAAI